jgi:hypothetical protein
MENKKTPIQIDGVDYLWDEACLEWRAEGNTPLHADE